MIILGMVSGAGGAPASAVTVFNGKFNGTNGSNIFLDTQNRHAISILSNVSSIPSITTAQFQEGTSSLSVPATSSAQYSYVICDSTGYSSDFEFTGDFRVTLRFRTAGSSGSILASFGTFYIVLTYAGANTINLTNWVGLGHPNTLTCSNTYTLNAWHKCVLERTGGTLKLTLNDDDANSDSMTVSGTFGDGQIRLGNNFTAANPLIGCFIDNVIVESYTASSSFSYQLVCQLQLNGSNGSTTFTDSLGRHTTTRTGTGTVSTAAFYEGNSSYTSPVGNNYLTTADASSDFIWTGNFSITMWFRPSSTSVSSVLFSLDGMHLKTNTSGSTITLNTGSSHGSLTMTPGNTFTNNAWNKVTFKRVGTTTYLILNDNTGSQATTTNSNMQNTIGDGNGINWGNQTAFVASTAQVYLDNITIIKG